MKTTEHIAIFQIAVIALNRLVENGPNLLGPAALGGTPGDKQAESREVQNRRKVIEQSSLSAVKGGTDLFSMLGDKQRQSIENLPARLGLRTIERIDQVGNELGKQLGFTLCHE